MSERPCKALEIYRAKDAIARPSAISRRAIYGEPPYHRKSLEGKIFVQFVALIFLSYIQKAMSEHDLFKQHTLQELLDELDIVERFDQTGKRHHMGEITKKQMHLYECMR